MTCLPESMVQMLRYCFCPGIDNNDLTLLRINPGG